MCMEIAITYVIMYCVSVILYPFSNKLRKLATLTKIYDIRLKMLKTEVKMSKTAASENLED